MSTKEQTPEHRMVISEDIFAVLGYTDHEEIKTLTTFRIKADYTKNSLKTRDIQKLQYMKVAHDMLSENEETLQNFIKEILELRDEESKKALERHDQCMKKANIREPKNIVFVYDSSESMTWNCLTFEGKNYTKDDMGIYHILSTISCLLPGDTISICYFTGNGYIFNLLDEQDNLQNCVTIQNEEHLKKNINHIKQNLRNQNGGTLIASGIKIAYKVIKHYNLHNASLILISDGHDSKSPDALVTKSDSINLITNLNNELENIDPPTIFTIGYGCDINSEVLNSLGFFYFLNDGGMIVRSINHIITQNLIGKECFGYSNQISDKYYAEYKDFSKRMSELLSQSIEYKNCMQTSTNLSFFRSRTEMTIDNYSLNILDLARDMKKWLKDNLENTTLRRAIEDLYFRCFMNETRRTSQFISANRMSQIQISLDYKYFVDGSWSIPYLLSLSSALRNGYFPDVFTFANQPFGKHQLSLYDSELKRVENIVNYISFININSFQDAIKIAIQSNPEITQQELQSIENKEEKKTGTNTQDFIVEEKDSGCFSINSTFRSQDKVMTVKDIQNALNKKEEVFLLGANDTYHKVLLMTITNQPATFRKIGNLVISDWHPIFYNGEWTFPAKISKETKKVTGFVNFQIKGGIIDVDGVKCVGLAHGITDNEVTNHEFYGTEKVIKSLKEIYGENTTVMVTNHDVKRDNGLVTGFVQIKE